MKTLLHIILTAILGVLVSCSSPELSQAEFVTIPARGWAYADTLAINVPTADSIAVGRLAVAVRHSNAYLYRNLWLEVSTPLADTVVADTVNVLLADNYGRWYGRGVGVSYMLSDTLPGHVCLTRGKPVRVRHIMRVDTLADIEQIGLTFIPD